MQTEGRFTPPIMLQQLGDDSMTCGSGPLQKESNPSGLRDERQSQLQTAARMLAEGPGYW